MIIHINRFRIRKHTTFIERVANDKTAKNLETLPLKHFSGKQFSQSQLSHLPVFMGASFIPFIYNSIEKQSCLCHYFLFQLHALIILAVDIIECPQVMSFCYLPKLFIWDYAAPFHGVRRNMALPKIEILHSH